MTPNDKSPIFEVFIPVNKHVVKKNSRPIQFNRRTRRPFLGKSTEQSRAENQMTSSIYLRRREFGLVEPIDFPVWCVFQFFFPKNKFTVKAGNRKGMTSNRLPDLSNLYELPQDCLQKAGVLVNDSLISAHDGSRRILHDGGYGLRIVIFGFVPNRVEYLHPPQVPVELIDRPEIDTEANQYTAF